ncbi:MerR family DNA-binding transcriptional regulator [Staphylococcus sp. FSL K6-0223]
MLIKEISEETGASIRSIRYYEEKGLLNPNRLGNGYREYGSVAK